MAMRTLILRNLLSPGDVVLLTAAVRDLHRCYPKRFVTDVRMPCPRFWENNPYLTPLDERDPRGRVNQCEYPLIHRSNQSPVHFLYEFSEFLNEALKVRRLPGRGVLKRGPRAGRHRTGERQFARRLQRNAFRHRGRSSRQGRLESTAAKIPRRSLNKLNDIAACWRRIQL